jgi:hypothetical protein
MKFRVEKPAPDAEGGSGTPGSGAEPEPDQAAAAAAGGTITPQFAVTSCECELTELTLSIEGSWFTWVYNVLAALLQESIRYLLEHY